MESLLFANSISEIVSLCKTKENGLISEFTGEQLAFFNKMFDSPLPMRYALHIPRTAVMDIVEKVKNTVLEWTLRLEAEGVLGEGMTFNDKEKRSAQAMPQTINNYYGSTNVINGNIDKSAILSGNNNTIEFSYEKAKDVIAEVEKSISIENMQNEDKETALEMLSDIRDKIDQKKKPAIIKSALLALKDFIISTGASLVGSLLQSKIMGLF